jgi:hypothetical protein
MTDEELTKLYKEYYQVSHEAALRAVFNAGWEHSFQPGTTLTDVVEPNVDGPTP